MTDVLKINVDENFSMSFLTANVIYKAGGKNWWDALALYIRYIQQSKRQRTNQPYCNDSYMIKGLGWWRSKFYKIKKILTDLWLIDTIRDNSDDKTYVKIYYLASGEKTKQLIEEELASPFYRNKKEVSVLADTKKEKSTVADTKFYQMETDETQENWILVSAVADRSPFWGTPQNGTQMLKVINNINAFTEKNFPSNSDSENKTELVQNEFKFNDGSIEYYATLVTQQTKLKDVVNILWPLFPHFVWYKWSKKEVEKALKQFTLDYDFVYNLIYDMKLLARCVEAKITKRQWFMHQRIDGYVPYTAEQREELILKIVTFIKRNNKDKELFEKRAHSIASLIGVDKYRKVFRSIPANPEDRVDLSGMY